MLVNLTDVLSSEGKSSTMQIDLEMNTFINRAGKFRIIKKEPLQLLLKNMGTGKAHIEGEVTLVIEMCCDRCLKDIEKTFALSFFREVLAPDKEQDVNSDDQNFMEGYQLDVEALISSEILMNWPMKILCQEECKGICTKCGKDLNIGNCDCDTFVPDPRMAAIKDIFNANNKEV